MENISKGVVIAKNGFFVADRDPKPQLIFDNIKNYINQSEIPFQ